MDSFVELMIPIVAMVLSIGGPLVVAVLAIQASHRKDMALQELVANATAAGRSPEEVRALVETLRPAGSGRRTGFLKAGIVLVFAAVSMAVVAVLQDQSSLIAPAAYSFFIGAAFIVIWRVIERIGGTK